MANEVVLGDLALDSRDDCLKFDSHIGGLTIPIENYLAGESLRMLVDISGSISYNFLIDTREDGGNALVLRNIEESGGWHVENCRAFVNGVEVFTSDPILFDTWLNVEILFTSPQPVSRILSRHTGNLGFKGSARDIVTKNGLYIQNGDFGSTTLIDHSGNGNDGTIVGATWWKKGVNENYATSQLFKSTLTSPLTEDQHVVYTDAEPYYASDDVFWNPFNQDVNFDFTVAPLGGTGSIGIAGLNSLNISMTISF